MLVGLVRGKTFAESIPNIGGGSPSGVFFVAIILSVGLIPFFAFREIGRVIGKHELRSLIFTDGAELHFSLECAKGPLTLLSWGIGVMTEGILTVFGILAGAVVLFASGRVRPDVVAILVVLALNLSGVLTIQEALGGFGQPVVALIAAVSIVGEGLIATGVAYRLGEAVMKAGGSNEARLVALVMMLAGTVGAFMSSSAIVAMFIPVVLSIANKIGLNRKRMLMPLSIAALISGMMTLIASSPNMIVEDTFGRAASPRSASSAGRPSVSPCSPPPSSLCWWPDAIC